MIIIKFIILCITLISLGLYINMKIGSIASFIVYKIDETRKDTLYSLYALICGCIFLSIYLTFF